MISTSINILSHIGFREKINETFQITDSIVQTSEVSM